VKAAPSAPPPPATIVTSTTTSATVDGRDDAAVRPELLPIAVAPAVTPVDVPGDAGAMGHAATASPADTPSPGDTATAAADAGRPQTPSAWVPPSMSAGAGPSSPTLSLLGGERIRLGPECRCRPLHHGSATVGRERIRLGPECRCRPVHDRAQSRHGVQCGGEAGTSSRAGNRGLGGLRQVQLGRGATDRAMVQLEDGLRRRRARGRRSFATEADSVTTARILSPPPWAMGWCSLEEIWDHAPARPKPTDLRSRSRVPSDGRTVSRTTAATNAAQPPRSPCLREGTHTATRAAAPSPNTGERRPQSRGFPRVDPTARGLL